MHILMLWLVGRYQFSDPMVCENYSINVIRLMTNYSAFSPYNIIIIDHVYNSTNYTLYC